MSSKGLGGFSRLLNRLTWLVFKQERVGMDEVGNRYYRKLEKVLDGNIVEKRFFKPPERGVYVPESLPPEWSQWLRKTRAEVPSDEDIARGITQRELLKQRVSQLEAEDAKRRFQERTTGGSAGSTPDMGSFVQQISSQYEKDAGTK